MPADNGNKGSLMRIADSDIQMSSYRTFTAQDEKSESLRIWVDKDNPASTPSAASDRVTISEDMKARLESMKGRLVRKEDLEPSAPPGSEMFIRKLLLEFLTGRKIKVMDVKRAGEEDVPAPKGTDRGEKPPQTLDKEGWGLVYNRRETHTEREAVAFNASGIIKTADGREFKFSLELLMDRTSVESTEVGLRAGDARKVDPLVINFDGAAVELESGKFAFDIDSDGTQESVSFVKSGSGFLAIDLNSDGKVNNGGELFGPSSGNGFAELSGYDSDHNSWIDENDPAYDLLGIWTRDASGQDVLTGLKEKGVGAIYLGYAQTLLDVRDSENNLNGQIRSSGIYLNEDGAPGTVQQIDLVA